MNDRDKSNAKLAREMMLALLGWAALGGLVAVAAVIIP